MADDINALLAELDNAPPDGQKRTRPPLPVRYMKIEDFNPDSSDQVQALARSLGVRLPRRKDNDDPDALSTERKYLKQAAKRHPVFGLILECRERAKLLSTYRWTLDAASRVHTTLGHHPSTWRKSSRDYNLQNIPKRSELAVEFRRMIVAPAGCVLIEWDSSAIEAVLVGYYARSERLMRLARAGIHDWFNAHVHGEGFSSDSPEAELRILCREARRRYSKQSREVAKRVIHMTNYRGTPERMHDEYPEEFATTREARRLQNLYLDTPPGEDLKRWWRVTLDRAYHDKFLTSTFGGRHRFFAVYAYNRSTASYGLGDDAKRAIAYLPQHAASMIQDQFVLELWEGPAAPWMRLVVHDSLIAVAPASEALEVARLGYRAFTRPIAELGGLAVGAECQVSGIAGNWAPRSPANPLGMETIDL